MMTVRQPAIGDWPQKALPEPDVPDGASRPRWNLLRGDLFLPACVLRESALSSNITLMADWCQEHRVVLAPHGKTTMCPDIVMRQIEAGGWGVSVATVPQARVYRAAGVRRVLLANQLVDTAGIAWARTELADPDFEFYCLVDSVAGVRALETRSEGRPVNVLVELGVMAGRTGCRTLDEAARVAEAAYRTAGVELCGVECFEGIFHGVDMEADRRAVDSMLARLDELASLLSARGMFERCPEIIVSAGGSLYFDRVADLLVRESMPPRKVVIRSGCAAIHDSNFFEQRSPLGVKGSGARRLLPALEVWGVVLSRPEPDLAIVGAGKRDVGCDIALPDPLVVSRNGQRRPIDPSTRAVNINDQHLYLRLSRQSDLAVGDLVGLGISHPCTTLDKWRVLPVIDDDYNVTDRFVTHF
jgi:D-serine dehydratase